MTNPPFPSYPGPEFPGQGMPSYGPASQGDGRVYASWPARVGAAILDWLACVAVSVIPIGVGMWMAFKDASIDEQTNEWIREPEPTGILVVFLGVIVALAFDIWNRGVRVGKTGASIGKMIVGIRVVNDRTGRLLGAGNGFLRWLVGTVIGMIPCMSFADLLWPLWDPKKQTLHDKAVSSVALRI